MATWYQTPSAQPSTWNDQSRRGHPYEAVAPGSFFLLWKGTEALVEQRAAYSAHLKASNSLVLSEKEGSLGEGPHFAPPAAHRVVAAHQLLDFRGCDPSEADVDGPDAILASLLFSVGAAPSLLNCRMFVGHLQAAVFASSTN